MEKSVRELVLVAIGQASVCWIEDQGERVFDSDQAIQIADKLLDDIRHSVADRVNHMGIDSQLNRPDYELADQIILPT